MFELNYHTSVKYEKSDLSIRLRQSLFAYIVLFLFCRYGLHLYVLIVLICLPVCLFPFRSTHTHEHTSIFSIGKQQPALYSCINSFHFAIRFTAIRSISTVSRFLRLLLGFCISILGQCSLLRGGQNTLTEAHAVNSIFT